MSDQSVNSNTELLLFISFLYYSLRILKNNCRIRAGTEHK